MKRPTGIQHGLLILNDLTASLQVSAVLPDDDADANADSREPEKTKRRTDDAHVVSLLRYVDTSILWPGSGLKVR